MSIYHYICGLCCRLYRSFPITRSCVLCVVCGMVLVFHSCWLALCVDDVGLSNLSPLKVQRGFITKSENQQSKGR